MGFLISASKARSRAALEADHIIFMSHSFWCEGQLYGGSMVSSRLSISRGVKLPAPANESMILPCCEVIHGQDCGLPEQPLRSRRAIPGRSFSKFLFRNTPRVHEDWGRERRYQKLIRYLRFPKNYRLHARDGWLGWYYIWKPVRLLLRHNAL